VPEQLIAGDLGGSDALDGEIPGRVEIGVELADGRQRKALPAQTLVAVRGGELQRLLGRVVLQVERARGVRDQGQPGEQSCLEPGAVRRRPVEGATDELDAFVPVPVQVPQPGQLGREAASRVRVGGGEPPVQGGPQVVVLALESGAPGIEIG
jgi:hypothetical protein